VGSLVVHVQNRRTRGDQLGMNLLRYSLERVPINPSSNQACRQELNFGFTKFYEVRTRRVRVASWRCGKG
jgi:hypothetical protein